MTATMMCMMEALSYLPRLLLNGSFESLAHGYQWFMRDLTKKIQWHTLCHTFQGQGRKRYGLVQAES
ncbi:hypothetical protein AX14_002782 [Amanita brunnescens Koide BX004]|nr:hypothetical protein AX14_002782 [Amanita brunnescens Koide BX004]